MKNVRVHLYEQRGFYGHVGRKGGGPGSGQRGGSVSKYAKTMPGSTYPSKEPKAQPDQAPGQMLNPKRDSAKGPPKPTVFNGGKKLAPRMTVEGMNPAAIAFHDSIAGTKGDGAVLAELDRLLSGTQPISSGDLIAEFSQFQEMLSHLSKGKYTSVALSAASEKLNDRINILIGKLKKEEEKHLPIGANAPAKVFTIGGQKIEEPAKSKATY